MNTEEAELLYRMKSAAQNAGTMLVEMRGQGKVALVDRANFVTNADHASDKLIASALPGHIRYYSEETPQFPLERLRRGRAFIVDPIDGTRNYSHPEVDEREFWGVSIAYVENGVVKIAVVSAPGRKQLYWAHDGGVYQEGCDDLAVSTIDDMSLARVFGDWTKKKEQYPRCMELLAKVGLACPYPMIAMSCTMAMVAVARGRTDVYFHTSPNPEDHAAAGLIVQAAGGKVTDFHGDPWSPFSQSILATNGHIHDRMLEILNS